MFYEVKFKKLQSSRGEPVCSPVAHAIARAPSLEIVGAGYILPVAPPTGNASTVALQIYHNIIM